MPLPVDKILADEGLVVKEVSLSKNLDVFGCCVLLDGEVPIYDVGTDQYKRIRYPAKTILIDPNSVSMYGEGAKRNTLIHEAIHWEKDKRYFEILAIRHTDTAEKLYPILCRHTETYYEPSGKKKTKENEVRWLEWQAHRLAPRILMPAKSFRKKAEELISEIRAKKTDDSPSCDGLIEALSKFFIVSRSSVKYRLLEVGLMEELVKFDDYEDVYAEVNSRDEFVPITPSEAFELLHTNTALQKWIQKDCFIFAEGYFVLASPKYVKWNGENWRLTKTAKNNLPSCVINIHEHRYVDYKNAEKDFGGYAILTRTVGIDRRLVAFHPKYQSKMNVDVSDIQGYYDAFSNHLNDDNRDEENTLRRMLGDPETTLCQCLWFLMQNRGWKYPKPFVAATQLNENYHGKIKNDTYNNMGTGILMAVCVGLQLRLRLIEKLFEEKSEHKLKDNREPDRTYIRILEELPRISVPDFNEILRSRDMKELGSEIKK